MRKYKVVAKGQVWQDTRTDRWGRTFKVMKIEDDRAVVYSLSSNRTSEIRLDRFNKNYELVKFANGNFA